MQIKNSSISTWTDKENYIVVSLGYSGDLTICGRVNASYPAAPQLEFVPAYRVSWLRFPVILSFLPGKSQDSTSFQIPQSSQRTNTNPPAVFIDTMHDNIRCWQKSASEGLKSIAWTKIDKSSSSCMACFQQHSPERKSMRRQGVLRGEWRYGVLFFSKNTVLSEW
jgi:hypothetical protein